MSANTSDSTVDTALISADAVSAGPDSVQSSVLTLFEGCAPQLLRYVGSFGLSPDETEDVVQDAFLLLFKHLSLGRDETNLRGWLFQVTHNLALKRRQRILKHLATAGPHDTAVRSVDPAPNPEERLMRRERDGRLRAVVDALSERERRCLFLRAEGLTYRDIAQALRVSLGAVAKAMSRALMRLARADGG